MHTAPYATGTVLPQGDSASVPIDSSLLHLIDFHSHESYRFGHTPTPKEQHAAEQAPRELRKVDGVVQDGGGNAIATWHTVPPCAAGQITVARHHSCLWRFKEIFIGIYRYLWIYICTLIGIYGYPRCDS